MHVSTTALSTSNIYFNKSQNILKIRHRAYIGYFSLLATIVTAIYPLLNQMGVNTSTDGYLQFYIIFLILLCSSFLVYTFYLMFKGREYKIYYIISRCHEWLDDYFSVHCIISADWGTIIAKMYSDTLIDYNKTSGTYIFVMMLENYPEHETQILEGIRLFLTHKNNMGRSSKHPI